MRNEDLFHDEYDLYLQEQAYLDSEKDWEYQQWLEQQSKIKSVEIKLEVKKEKVHDRIENISR